MASQYGPHMQAQVGPQSMNRQDIARLSSFNKALLEYQRNVNSGLQPPSIAEIRELYEVTSTLPGLVLASSWSLSCTDLGRALPNLQFSSRWSLRGWNHPLPRRG
eukprot:COSAG02_NODE_1696_length_11261_cov_132.993639_6_plen_105_part_00